MHKIAKMIIENFRRSDTDEEFCSCNDKETLFIVEDGIRCVLCGKLIQFEIKRVENVRPNSK